MGKGSNRGRGEGKRRVLRKWSWGKRWQSVRGGPYGKAGPPNSKVLFLLQDPELAMCWVSVLQLCLGSESLRETTVLLPQSTESNPHLQVGQFISREGATDHVL